MQIPAFRDIISRLTRQATVSALRVDIPASHAALRFNVTVRPETRAFLAAQAESLGSSLSAISGNILDSVAAAEFESVGYSRELLTSRFYLLLREHGLSLPAAAEVVRSRGITVGDMSDQKLLMEKLDTKTLEWLSQHFHVKYDWLAGKSQSPISVRTGSWYKGQMEAARRLLTLSRGGARVELVIARQDNKFDFAEPEAKDENSPRQEALCFVPFVCVSHQAGPRESYDTFEVWESGYWNYWRCREHIKMVIYFATKISSFQGGNVYIRGISLPPKDFSALYNCSALVPSIFGKHRSAAWCPEDFVEPGSAVAKDKPEWASILAREDYRPHFDHMKQIVAG